MESDSQIDMLKLDWRNLSIKKKRKKEMEQIEISTCFLLIRIVLAASGSKAVERALFFRIEVFPETRSLLVNG